MPLLTLSGIAKQRGSLFVLRDVSFSMGPGTVVGVIGGRGAGKKQLLRVLAGIDSPDAGSIVFADQDITRFSARHRRNLGLVSTLQAAGFRARLGSLFGGEPTVGHRLTVAAATIPDRSRRLESVDQVLGQLGLHHASRLRSSQLSSGERGRVALGELLVSRPRLIVLDEPFKELDSYTLPDFCRLLRELASQLGLSIFLSDRSGHARAACDRLVHLNAGRVTAVEDLDPSAPRQHLAEPAEADGAFLSYSRHDQAAALQVVEHLRACGIPVWIDQRGIPAASHWDHEIEQALHRCPCLILLLSPRSAASQNVLDEVSYALEREIPVFPLLLEDCDIPYRLRRIQHLDLRQGLQEPLARLAERIAAL